MKIWNIRRLEATSSTNDDARRAAESGEAEGLVIHAVKQTSGRGRHGRAWESPEGNLYCSVLLRPSGTRRDYGFYSFVAALALADTVRELAPHAAVTLKWPNDVLVDGKKIAGILLESGDDFLIIGMGLNIRHHPEDALHPATSLKDSGSNPAVDAVLDRVLHHLSRSYEMLKNKGFSAVRAAWLEHAQKGQMTVKLPDETLMGEFIDIDAEGHLRLRLADGAERAIATGDVFFGL